ARWRDDVVAADTGGGRTAVAVVMAGAQRSCPARAGGVPYGRAGDRARRDRVVDPAGGVPQAMDVTGRLLVGAGAGWARVAGVVPAVARHPGRARAVPALDLSAHRVAGHVLGVVRHR